MEIDREFCKDCKALIDVDGRDCCEDADHIKIKELEECPSIAINNDPSTKGCDQYHAEKDQ